MKIIIDVPKEVLQDLQQDLVNEMREEELDGTEKCYVALELPLGVCVGQTTGVEYSDDMLTKRYYVSGIPIIGDIVIDGKWVFDTYEEAFECFRKTGGDKYGS